MLKEIFYWTIYYLENYNLKKDKNIKESAFFAALIFGLFQAINIGSMMGLINILMKRNVFSHINANVFGIILGVTLLFLNFYFLYRNLNNIISKFEKMDSERKKDGKHLFWGYYLASLIIFYLIG